MELRPDKTPTLSSAPRSGAALGRDASEAPSAPGCCAALGRDAYKPSSAPGCYAVLGRDAYKAPSAPDRDAALGREVYEAPRLIRVRVETAILHAGNATADENCTRHWHSDQTTCAM